MIRSDLRSEEIIFKKISAQNKKYEIAPKRNNISAQKTRKPVKPATNPKEIAKRNQELFRETGYLAEESQGGGIKAVSYSQKSVSTANYVREENNSQQKFV